MKEIPILPMLYDIILWISPKISQFPKKYKYTLGDRITNCMLDILESIIEAELYVITNPAVNGGDVSSPAVIRASAHPLFVVQIPEEVLG